MDILAMFHDTLSHPNVEKCYYTIRSRYYWRGLYTDIVAYTQSCDTCLRIRHRKRPPLYLKSREVESLFSCCHLDFVGPIESYHKSPYKYVFSATDSYSGHTIFVPTKTVSAEETAQVFHEHWLLKFGFVPKITTDRGQNFLSAFLKTLLDIANIKHLRTAPYHPESNSVVEIRNRILGHSLRAYITPDTKDWHKLLPAIQFGYSILEQPGLGLSSYEILYSQKARMPIDVDIINKAMESNVPSFAPTFLPSWEVIRQIVSNNIADSKRRTEFYHNQNARKIDVKVGDRVYKLLEGPPSGIHAGVSTKILPKYDGPYTILDIYGNAAKLQRIYDGKVITPLINISKLKLVKHCRTDLATKYNQHADTTAATEPAPQTNDQSPVLTTTEPTQAPERGNTSTPQANQRALPSTLLNPEATPFTPHSTVQTNTSLDVNVDSTSIHRQVQDETRKDDFTSAHLTLDDMLASPTTITGNELYQPKHTPVDDQASQHKSFATIEQLVQQAINRYEQAHTPKYTTTRPLQKYKISQIIRRQKIQGKWHYRIKLADSGETIWALPEQIPQHDLDIYMHRTQRHRAQMARAKRRY